MIKSINGRPSTDFGAIPPQIAERLPPPDLPRLETDITTLGLSPDQHKSFIHSNPEPSTPLSHDSRTLSAPPIPSDSGAFVHVPYQPLIPPTTQIENQSERVAAAPGVDLSPQSEPSPSIESDNKSKTVFGWLANRIALYGAAELTGSVTAAIGIGLASVTIPHSAAVGIIGTLSENLGLYSVLCYCAMRKATRLLEEQGRSHTWKTRAEVGTTLIAQFGVAEVFDSLLIRPFLIGSGSAVGWFLGEHVLGQGFLAMATGALGCKIVADVIYWSMVEATGVVLNKAEDKK